jgi:RNA polymerase sigma-70 factor, ECF subfamily
MNAPPWQALSRSLVRRFRAWGASPELAEDLRQETLLRVQRGLDGLEDQDRMGPWVARIARNAWIDHLRARRDAHPLPEGDLGVPPPLRTDAPEADDPGAFVASWMPLLIASLDEPDRTMLRRVELEGWSQARLAADLGVAPSTARTRVQAARRRLRARLDDCCDVAWEGGAVVDWRLRGQTCACGPGPVEGPASSRIPTGG